MSKQKNEIKSSKQLVAGLTAICLPSHRVKVAEVDKVTKVAEGVVAALMRSRS